MNDINGNFRIESVIRLGTTAIIDFPMTS